jgi:ATP-dependent DNA helicase RecG
MLTKDELIKLLSDLESDSVERTVSTTNTDKFCEAICAFANDYPNRRSRGPDGLSPMNRKNACFRNVDRLS